MEIVHSQMEENCLKTEIFSLEYNIFLYKNHQKLYFSINSHIDELTDIASYNI